MISDQIEAIEAVRLTTALEAEVARRTATLPDGLPKKLVLTDAQVGEWTRQWGRGGRTVPLTFGEALELARTFADPILGGKVGSGEWRGGEWRPADGNGTSRGGK